jgi:hypothetical protein
MLKETELIKRIKLGRPVPSDNLIDRRSKGLQAIRVRCLWQLMFMASKGIDSISLRWNHAPEYINAQTILSDALELTFYGASSPVTGLFKDLWILCYPEDPEIKQKVEEEIARMCQEAMNQS